MQKNTFDYMTNVFKVDEKILRLINEAESEIADEFEKLDDIAMYNQYKVLTAFQKNKISDRHFNWSTGYGYDDIGREALEKIYSDIFNTEASLVRPIIVNGTHALTLTLTGILRPGDELIYCTGGPYDTLEEVIGIRGEGKGTMKEFGITYKQVELTPEGDIDYDALEFAIGPKTRMVSAQRSTGYDWRKAISVEQLGELVSFVKEINPDIICMADNCYGEFLDVREPTDVGMDVIAGSLIKNPGGGLALTGGYITGRKDLIDSISWRMTSPGIGGECGLMFGQTRAMMQGIFVAPKVVNGALKGAILCSRAFEKLGYETCPKSTDMRSDIIEAVKLESPEAMVAFCEGIQAAAPVDAFVKPEPWDMPGYEDRVVMAAGAFVQGSSIELSADGPVRDPYIVYFQGGLTYEYSKFGVIKALQSMYEQALLKNI